jgi:uncharacterized protein DUF6220
MSGFRRAYSTASVVLLVELALQFYFIAAAALHVWGAAPSSGEPTSAQIFSGFKQGDTFANLHVINGSLVIPVTILVMIGLAFGARHTTRTKWLTGALFGLMVVQFVLAGLGFSGNAVAGAIAGLHGINALVIVSLTAFLVRENWAFGTEPVAQPSAAPAPVPSGGP